MVIISDPAGLWTQLSSAFFCLSAWWGDILIIKIMLVFAFGFLALYEALGCPGWTTEPSPYGSTGYFSVDGFVWQVVCGTFAFWGAIMLLRDEMPVRLQSEDEEAMWRYFWRRSGMPRSEFQEVLARGEWLRVKKGERIMSHVQVYEYLHLLVEGRCSCFTALRKGCEEASSTGMCSTGDQLRNYNLLSGDIFSFALCSIFGVSLGFEKISGHHLEVYADTDCLLYRWHVQQLDHMAVRSSPACTPGRMTMQFCGPCMGISMQQHC
mmetsp:Transcript_16780/g.36298  ORF Transcript_16780/g.36298 Transcript_16780/m.36298 type:complete len:266 (-) Transcript_16780:149-946(-)